VIVNRRRFLSTVGAQLLAGSLTVAAQPSKRARLLLRADDVID
jgi:hypothetical protein